MQETFIVGGKEYTCMPMNAFAANKLFLRLQKIALPVIGSFIGTGKSVGDIDVSSAAQMLAEHIDESIMDSIIMPMFSEAKVFSCEHKKFIKSEMDINTCFTTATLFDFYELVFLVGRHQFAPFFAQIAGRFGVLTQGVAQIKNSPAG